MFKIIIETRLNCVFSSQWLKHVSQRNALSAELFRMSVSRLWLFLYNMASKTSQTNLSEQGKLLLAELGTGFLEAESKGHI